MTALDAYQARIDAVNAQRSDLQLVANDSDRWSKWAEAFRFNPRRELDANSPLIVSEPCLKPL